MRQWLLVPFAVTALSLFATNSCIAENAAHLHSPALSEAVTTWCIGQPDRFVAAAKSLGYESASTSEGIKATSTLKLPSGADGNIVAWARSGNQADSKSFEEICALAFKAFGPAPAQGSEESEEEKAALLIVGGLIAGLTGLGTERKRTRNGEASGLRVASGELQDAVSRYVEFMDDSSRVDGRAKGVALRQLVREWSKFEEGKAAEAEAKLADILREEGDPPYIGDLGDDPKHKTNGEQLSKTVAEIRECVLKIAARVEAFSRLAKRRGVPKDD